jgi:hypothetical protein
MARPGTSLSSRGDWGRNPPSGEIVRGGYEGHTVVKGPIYVYDRAGIEIAGLMRAAKGNLVQDMLDALDAKNGDAAN